MESTLYQIKGNETLFNSWMKQGNEFLEVAAVVQNDMELTSDDLNIWYLKTNEIIKLKNQKLKSGHLQTLIDLRNATVKYIKGQ